MGTSNQFSEDRLLWVRVTEVVDMVVLNNQEINLCNVPNSNHGLKCVCVCVFAYAEPRPQ